jgi:CheY-like chemotaxis protein
VKTVLVSYEGRAVGAAILEALTGAGYDVLVAPPSTAIATARRHGAVDVLVTDHMPLLQRRLDLAERGRAEQPQLRVLYAPGLTVPGAYLRRTTDPVTSARADDKRVRIETRSPGSLLSVSNNVPPPPGV